MTTIDAITKAAALELLRDGLATQAEVARLLGTTRQVLTYWIRTEGLDPVKARQAWLRRIWKQALQAYSKS